MKLFYLLVAISFYCLNSCAVQEKDKVPAPAQASQPAVEVPATGPVPQKVTDDCLAALRKMVGERGMQVISARRGESCFIVEVWVEGVEKPWRCFHDGTECFGTEYQGEG